ncbi:hypothetical protein [Corynebacterium timonense]|uniref:PPE family protein n=1 Tax=Corynebacterium timonense TaxID=441500 RepID=A0A1H1UYR8_9CORY|nr:hypothetical protein [Corynebacterium timonense]SDS77635.1 hypothetical protein SAMN04488539_2368 [Corynebacterium timonense]
MGNQLLLDVVAVRDAVSQLDHTARLLSGSSTQNRFVSLATFSPVSGLDMAGRTHGTIAGTYEPQATGALASHIRDAAVLLESNLDNTVRADVDFSRLVSHIGVARGLGMVSAANALRSPAPAPPLVNATTGRFANAAPVAGPQVSLPGLNSLFSTTNPAEATSASGQWSKTAGLLSQTVAALDGAKAALASSASTSWVQAALERLSRIQWAGGTYAGHATALAAHTANLAAVAAANQILTAAAHATWVALPSLEHKLAFEQAFLVPFPTTLTSGLVPTNPVFNQLLPGLNAMPGGSVTPGAPQAPTVPAFDAISLPRVVSEALRQHGYGQLAEPMSPHEVVSQFGEVTPEVVRAISEGATPTQAASLAAASMPATLAPGIASAGGIADPLLPAAGSGAHAAPRLTGAAGVPLSLGAGAAPAGAAVRGPSAGVQNGESRGGALVGSPGGGLNRGFSGTGGHATSIGPVATSTSTAASRAVPVGGPVSGPAGGAAPRRGSETTRKGARVTAVTSAVEREGNLRALLGQAPAVLPGVIGYNVTQPQPR